MIRVGLSRKSLSISFTDEDYYIGQNYGAMDVRAIKRPDDLVGLKLSKIEKGPVGFDHTTPAQKCWVYQLSHSTVVDLKILTGGREMKVNLDHAFGPTPCEVDYPAESGDIILTIPQERVKPRIVTRPKGIPGNVPSRPNYPGKRVNPELTELTPSVRLVPSDPPKITMPEDAAKSLRLKALSTGLLDIQKVDIPQPYTPGCPSLRATIDLINSFKTVLGDQISFSVTTDGFIKALVEYGGSNG